MLLMRYDAYYEKKQLVAKSSLDLHKHALCFLVAIHVPSPLTFLLVLDVTMTSCKNTMVLIVLIFKHMQMSLRFLYTNVGRLLFFNLDHLEMACRPFSCIRSSLLNIAGRTKSATPTSSPGSCRFRLLLSCRRPIGKREDPGDEVDVTQGSQYNNLVLVVTEFVNLILPLLFLYSSLTCLYFLHAFYQSGIKKKLAAFSKSNSNNNENLNKVFMAHLNKVSMILRR